VTPLDRAIFSDTLARALGDAEGRTRRGREGQQFVARQFSWAKVAAQLADLYESVAYAGPRLEGRHAAT
jgi:glycosyltransferase involved in cell wall biosynthesis